MEAHDGQTLRLVPGGKAFAGWTVLLCSIAVVHEVAAGHPGRPLGGRPTWSPRSEATRFTIVGGRGSAVRADARRRLARKPTQAGKRRLRDAREAGGAGLPHHHPQLAVQDVGRRRDAGLPKRGEAEDVGVPDAQGRRAEGQRL